VKSASTTTSSKLPDQPANGVTAGLDWASQDHAVSIVNDRGLEIARRTVEHTSAGLRAMVRLLDKHGVCEVAIERGDGPVVDALLDADLTVVVISPNRLKNLRSRYGSAGNKDDRFDAYVLADTLRTDRTRLRPLTHDSEATKTLRATVRARRELVKHRVALCNQLRAHLQSAFPGAVGLFQDLDSQISLKFLARFDSQERADWLSAKRLAAWLHSVGYSGRKDPADLHAHLQAVPRGPIGPDGAARAHVTRAMLSVLDELVEQIATLEAQITEQLALHADAHIFQSLPRGGTVRAARLLAEIGDARGRFPDAASLACLAGVAPSTRQSGKHKAVTYRWAVNKELRDAVCDFAGDSRRANPWAAKIYNDAIARGKDHPHATRILARAWLGVIWRCWQDETTYDPNRHNALQTLTNGVEAA
jgi:transposase